MRKLKYKLLQEPWQRLRNRLVVALEKVHYDEWKVGFRNQVIDLVWNGLLIALSWWALQSDYLVFKGFGVALGLLLFFSYVDDFRKLFSRR
jgi:hypothetical protein